MNKNHNEVNNLCIAGESSHLWNKIKNFLYAKLKEIGKKPLDTNINHTIADEVKDIKREAIKNIKSKLRKTNLETRKDELEIIRRCQEIENKKEMHALDVKSKRIENATKEFQLFLMFHENKEVFSENTIIKKLMDNFFVERDLSKPDE